VCRRALLVRLGCIHGLAQEHHPRVGGGVEANRQEIR
jgi:hypothetical protein